MFELLKVISRVSAIKKGLKEGKTIEDLINNPEEIEDLSDNVINRLRDRYWKEACKYATFSLETIPQDNYIVWDIISLNGNSKFPWLYDLINIFSGEIHYNISWVRECDKKCAVIITPSTVITCAKTVTCFYKGKKHDYFWASEPKHLGLARFK